MPKPPRIPAYRLHKARCKGVVTLNGRDVYLPGAYGSAESTEAYERLIAQWLADGRRPPLRDGESLSVAELLRDFLVHAKSYYRDADRRPTAEIDAFRYALRPVAELYAHTPAEAFGPSALRAVRQKMIDTGWCRSHINKQINRVKHVFKWGVSHELISPAVHQALATVPGLKRGRSEAAETDPVRPVPEERVNAIEPFVSRQVWALIRLQLLTGARAGELVGMRPIDLDTTGRIWVYAPKEHKTAHHGHERSIYLGPRAQRVVEEFLDRPLEAPLFSPAEAEAERRAARHAERRTPLLTGNRPGTNRRRKPKRTPAERYTVCSYRRAIARGCDRAFPHPELDRPKSLLSESETRELAAWQKANRWHPHQLRHTAATALRKQFGIEAARVILGHRSAQITEVYAELDRQHAVKVMERVG